jgi:biopolymer transport protein ExbD
MRRIHEKHQDPELGFQIAPMIDVVFVIMLFFMVLAGNRQVETELPMTLPSEEQSSDSNVTPMEEQVHVDVDGEIAHNEEPVTRDELKRNFQRLALQAKAEGGSEPTPIVVTISADPETPWEKVTDVMNAMSFARIGNVTFSIAEEL